MTTAAEDGAAEGRELAADLDLAPLPEEGGLFRQTFVADGVSAILFMLIGADFSALHRLSAPELYVFQGGAPLRLLTIDNDGPREATLGLDLAAGQQPQILVPAGCWQGSSSMGPWTLVTTVVTPPFEWSMFELAERSVLQQRWPQAGARIAELTRLPPQP